MSKPKTVRRGTFVLLLLQAAWTGVPIAAQTRAAQGAAGRNAPLQPPEPPLITFPQEGLSIEDAVRYALQNDPAIKLQDQAVRFQEGVVQEQAGPFDPTASGSVSYDYRITDLTSAVISGEQSTRDSIVNSILSIQQTGTGAQKTINLLEQARSGPLAGDALTALAQAAPSIAGTLASFDAILAGLTGPAASSLAQARAQFLDSAESTVKQTLLQGQQDLLGAQQQLNGLGPTPTQQVSRDFNFSFEVAKELRNGLVITPFFSGDLLKTSFRGQSPDSIESAAAGLGDTYTYEGGINLLVPLARGRGARGVDALERSSALERDASQLTLRFQASATALATALAYWDLRASQDAVGVANRSVELQTQLLRLTQGLIAAGELPQTDLARAQAAESRSRAELFDSQRVEHQARVALAIAMGVASNGEDATLPHARDAFPDPPSEADVQPSAAYFAQAASLRSDLAAAATHEQAGTILVQGAETNLRPRVDLNSSTYFTSLGQTNSLDHWAGPSQTASVQFEKPLGNNLFAGQLAERRADLAQRAIASTDLNRQVRLNVLQAAGSLPDALEGVRQGEAAVRFYQSTTDAEIQRFQIGEATLIDTVQTQQQQIDALLALVAARQQVAQLIAQLRFQTGTILQNGVVTRRNLIAVPGPVQGQP
jgi:outer membrane protein TolC